MSAFGFQISTEAQVNTMVSAWFVLVYLFSLDIYNKLQVSTDQSVLKT